MAREVVLDGDAVRAWSTGALSACRAARERIDAVNVFPVPDADTGSNVALTVAGGAEAVAAADRDADPAALAAEFARGAARAARGSSGIILSQWLVGFAAGLEAGPAGERIGTDGVVRALEAAARTARAAVPDPQEGTILTCAREVAEHARRRAGDGSTGSACDVLAAAADAARADLGRLSAGHEVLRAARVVDAGACALLVVLDALARALRDDPSVGGSDVDLAWLPEAGPDVVAGCPRATGGAFEVMMLVRPAWPGVDGLAAALQDVGDAVAVADAGGLRHAHVHCDEPAAAIDLVPPAARQQVVVRRIDVPAPAVRGLVVLTASPGMAAWYATCGAVTLVGAPGVQQVGRAAADSRTGRAVVVDAGVGLAGDPQDRPYDVLATPGDGLGVVVCLALAADPVGAPEAGSRALARVRAATPAGPDGVPVAVAGLVQEVPDAQGVTLVHGHDVDAAAARVAAGAVADAYPRLEVVVAGPAVGPAWWVGVD